MEDYFNESLSGRTVIEKATGRRGIVTGDSCSYYGKVNYYHVKMEGQSTNEPDKHLKFEQLEVIW